MPEDSEDPYPRMTLAAEGLGPGGERWSMQTGGPPEDYHRMIRIDFPDGSSDRFGISGPVPPLNSLWESVSGQRKNVIRHVVWAHPKVRRVRVRSKDGEQCDLLPVKDDLSAGVTLFVALLPWSSRVASQQAYDSEGHELPDVGGLD